MVSALAEIHQYPNTYSVPKNTLQALVKRGLIDANQTITESGRISIVASMSLAKQCEYLWVDLNRMSRTETLWDRMPWSKQLKPEPFALRYFEKNGYVGAHCEGGAIRTAVSALCLDALEESSIFYETSIDARKDACLRGTAALPYLEMDKIELILNQIEKVSRAKYLKSFSEIISYRDIQAWYPGLSLKFAKHLYKALPKSTFIEIARWLSSNPYNRNGWPDLTLIKGKTVRFVEVKTTDKLHASQLTTIPAIQQITGLEVSVLKLDK